MTGREIQTLTALLTKCEPGNLPLDVFVAIARITVMPGVEFIPLRQANKGIEVLLLPREPGDPIWPSMLHTPGTVLRPTDHTLKDAFNRLFTEELHMPYIEPQFVCTNLGRSARGSVFTLEYILDMTEIDGPMYKYYSCTDLPSAFIPDQKDMLERALAKFTGASHA